MDPAVSGAAAPKPGGQTKPSAFATVGRVVHFYSDHLNAGEGSCAPGGYNNAGTGPYAAMVTQTIEGSSLINLMVQPPCGAPFHEGEVAHQDDPLPEGETRTRYWVWPPRE